MSKSPNHILLARAAQIAAEFLDQLPQRPVGVAATSDELQVRLAVALPALGQDALAVLEQQAAAIDPGLVASAGPRYFGHVISGAHPAALALDWMTAAWDQNAVLHATSPANAVLEEVVGKWLIDLLDLDRTRRAISFGFVSGCQMAHVTALLAARHEMLGRQGWNVERQGLIGAPPLRVLVGAEAHGTVATALQYIGLGRDRAVIIPSDSQGRMQVEELRRAMAASPDPAIICAQAGGVNTGAFDDFPAIAGIARQYAAWLHVDGAFGLWAAASATRRHLTAGVEQADSWATDAHKWLNVPHDSGIVFTAHPAAHRAAMSVPGEAYLARAGGENRDPYQWVPEMSRRARVFAIQAALLAFGRNGLAEMIDRCCDLALRMRDLLQAHPAVTILNDVVLNQVLFAVEPAHGMDGEMNGMAADAFTEDVIAAIQADGTCWLGGTTWHGRRCLRLSVCNYRTTVVDIDLAAAAIGRAIDQVRAKRD
ncbi:MAG TPA: aminotransferase class V-fold PLP-dependent enzyme [Dongiaceae bacterium]|nr:aminotransferase class V-fold PLP-dependent enzyme [Dongiaceae bacterium]